VSARGPATTLGFIAVTSMNLKEGEGRFSTNAVSEKVKGIQVISETQIAYLKQLGGHGRNQAESSPTASLNTLISREI
jgi:hypothetical protein